MNSDFAPPGQTMIINIVVDKRSRVNQFYSGRERCHSVRAGLAALVDAAASDWVLVHDAARPCLPAADLDRPEGAAGVMMLQMFNQSSPDEPWPYEPVEWEGDQGSSISCSAAKN